MKRTIAVLMAVFMAFAAFAACDTKQNNDQATNSADPNMPAKDAVIIQIGDYKITFEDFNEIYNYYYEMYTMYGMLDPENEEEVNSFKQMLLDYQLENILPAFAAEKLGITLDAEEEKELEDMFEAQMATYLSQFDSVVDPTVTDELMLYEAKLALFKDDLNNQGIDYDEFIAKQKEDMRLSILSNKMIEEKIGEVKVDEAEVKAAYDAKIAELTEKYEKDITAYYTDYQEVVSGNATLPYFAPEGYYFVTYVYVANTSEDIRDYNPEIIMEEVESKIAEIKNEKDVDVRIEKFKALISEYGQDPLLQMEPFVNEGQLIHPDMTTQYYETFLEQARALKNKGDISEKFATEEGTMIMIRLDDVKAGPIKYDTIKEVIEEEMVTEVETELYNAAMDEWKTLVAPTINSQYLEYLGMSTEPTPTIDPNLGC